MFIFTLRFSDEIPPPFTEPDICVTHPVIALKLLRNFGHLITTLHLEYDLFFKLENQPHQPFCKIIEHYLAKYCSQSLHTISLQGGINTNNHIIFEDIQKPFINIKTVHTEKCTFGEELPFNRVFPNVKSLKLGFNKYIFPSAIRVQLGSVENLWFCDSIWLLTPREFKEEDIEEMFRRNSQLQNSVLHLYFIYSSNFIARLQEYCPNLQLLKGIHPFYSCSVFSFDAFQQKRSRNGRKTFTEITKSLASKKYEISLQKLYEFHEHLNRFPYWERKDGIHDLYKNIDSIN